jgi:hypothetical protein
VFLGRHRMPWASLGILLAWAVAASARSATFRWE